MKETTTKWKPYGASIVMEDKILFDCGCTQTPEGGMTFVERCASHSHVDGWKDEEGDVNEAKTATQIAHEVRELRQPGTTTYVEIRKFESGATRDTNEDKLEIRRFLSPLVTQRYCEYMHKHRLQTDGKLREPDNWKKGMPIEVYADSLRRHVHDVELHLDHAEEVAREPLEDALCAIIFNANGMLFELLKKKNGIN